MDTIKIDAIIFPQGTFAHLGGRLARMYGIRQRFGRALGTDRPFCTVQLGMNFITKVRDPIQRSLMYPVGHPLAGQDRYLWFRLAFDDQKNPVLVNQVESFLDASGDLLAGVLKPDPFADQAHVDDLIRQANEAKMAEATRPENRRRKLDAFLAAKMITPEEHAQQVEQQGLPAVGPLPGAPEPPHGRLGFPPV